MSEKLKDAESHPMELREFVKGAILQICNGVRDAQIEAKKSGIDAEPAPPVQFDRGGSVPQGFVYTGGSEDCATVLEFDLLVTESHEKGSKGGIGVFLGHIGFGGHREHADATQSHSRLRFSVPVALPRFTMSGEEMEE